MEHDPGLSPAERAAFLFGVLALHEGTILDAATTLDDMQDIAVTLLASQPDYLLPEYGQKCGHWLKTVLYNRRRDHVRAENRHRRIERKHAPELSARYGSGTAESAEKVVLRLLDEEDIRRRMLRLPPKLAVVAMLLYDDYNCAEIGQVLGIPAATARKRAQSIRSPKIRAALCL